MQSAHLKASELLLDACSLDGCPVSPSASCRDTLRASLDRFVRAMGLDYIRATCQRTLSLGGVAPEAHVLSFNVSTFPKAWESHYYSHRLYELEPAARLIRQELGRDCLLYGTFEDAVNRVFSRLGDIRKAQAYLEHLHQAFAHRADYGINSGVYLASGSRDRMVVLYAGGRESPARLQRRVDDSFWRALLFALKVSDGVMRNAVGCDRCSQPSVDGETAALSGFQRDILRFYVEHANATAREVAEALGISPNTVNYHLKGVRQRFGLRRVHAHALATLARENGLL